VDDQVHPREALERADVATLAADDAALHVVRWEGEDGYRRLSRLFRSDPLDGDGHDLPDSLLALLSSLLFDLANSGHRVPLGGVDDLTDQRFLRFLGRQPADPFQLAPVLLQSLLELGPHPREVLVRLLDPLLPGIQLTDLP